jgi:hypothetical protein
MSLTFSGHVAGHVPGNPTGRPVRRVRHEVRDGMAVIAFSASASTLLAVTLMLLFSLADRA